MQKNLNNGEGTESQAHYKQKPVIQENSMATVVIIGGGTAGLSAAYTLKKRGIDVIVLEANDRTSGRLVGDRVDGFSLDEGADFFCSSYDVAFRICDELELSLIRSKMKLGWYRNGRWVTTTPGLSVGKTLSGICQQPKPWASCLSAPSGLFGICSEKYFANRNI